MSHKFLIDGGFLSSMSTGVDRYAWQTIRQLDGMVRDLDVTILVPPKAADKPELKELKNIKIKVAKSDKAWTQVVFGGYARLTGSIPINFCNQVSMLAPRGITVLHDVCYAEDNDFFPDEERQWFLKIYDRIKKRCRVVVTVSEFSKERIHELLGIPMKNIVVAGNGWQHFDNVEINEDIFKDYPQVEKGNYYFTMTSANKNKNLSWVVENAKMAARKAQMRGKKAPVYVIGGKNLDKVFDFSEVSNIIYVGFLTDEDMKTWMKYCRAFIFPSFYEGFGIPPMEAASVGAKLIVSNTASLPEVCGDSAYYIDPDNPYVDLEELLENQVGPAANILKKYSWFKTAGVIYETLMRLSN